MVSKKQSFGILAAAAAVVSAEGVVDANAAAPTRAPDHFQQVGIAAGAVYSSLGSVMANPTADFNELSRADNDANRAIASLKHELRYYDWESLLGEDVARDYRMQLDAYIANLDTANREVHAKAMAAWVRLPATPAAMAKAVKATGKSTTDFAISLGTTASSLLPIPSDMFSDKSGQAYQVPTVATFNQSPSGPTQSSPEKSSETPTKSAESEKSSATTANSHLEADSSTSTASTATSRPGTNKALSTRTRTTTIHKTRTANLGVTQMHHFVMSMVLGIAGYLI